MPNKEINSNNYFFREGGKDYEQLLSKPKTITSLYVEVMKTENQRFEEFHNTSRENKIMKEKIEKAVKNDILVETPKNSICWCNQYGLVPKTNERLIFNRNFIFHFC
jgi:tRNA G18 (ribose-2'-O)-methylase SpoU